MAKRQVQVYVAPYKPIRRWREIWHHVPLSNNLQLWSSTMAMSLALFALFYNFLWEWGRTMGIDLPNVYAIPDTGTGVSPVGYVLFGLIALAAIIIFLIALGSIVALVIKMFHTQKEPVDLDNIPYHVWSAMKPADLAALKAHATTTNTIDVTQLHVLKEEIAALRAAKKQLDEFLSDIDNNPETKG